MRPPTFSRTFAIAVCLMAAGCAGKMKTEISNVGTPQKRLETGASYRLASAPYGETDANYAALARLLNDRLTGMGYKPSEGNDPRYLVQLAYSIRPQKVGSYDGTSPASADAEGWLARPSRSKPVYSVAIHVSERETGHEVYRVTASERHEAGDFAAIALSNARTYVYIEALQHRPQGIMLNSAGRPPRDSALQHVATLCLFIGNTAATDTLATNRWWNGMGSASAAHEL